MERESLQAAPPRSDSLSDSLSVSLSSALAAFPEAQARVDASGTRVAYRRAGTTGPVVVLLHGISSGAASWLPCATLLAAHARVIAWDAPGYGASTPLPMVSPRAADYADRLRALVQALGARPDAIVGHSLGALMGAAYLSRTTLSRTTSDKRPQKLLLISPAQGYGAPGLEQRAKEVARQRIEALETWGVAGLARRGPARLLSADADAAAKEWVHRNMSRLNPDGYRQAVAMLCRDDIDAHLARLPAGVTGSVACGTRDAVTLPTGAESLARRFGLPFTPIEHAGHACYIEQAATVAAWIRSVLKERPSPRPHGDRETLAHRQ